MRNYIYMAIMLIPAIAVLTLILIFAFTLQLFYLPTLLLTHLQNYDSEQARKRKNIVR